MNLVFPHQIGMFLYDEKIMRGADWDEYRRQYLGFGKANQKLDGLDATASAYILIFRYMESGKFKPLKERLFEKRKWF